MKNLINNGNTMNGMENGMHVMNSMEIAPHELPAPPIPPHEALIHEIPPHERMSLRMPPHIRGSLVSVLYDVETMKNVYGENYAFRMDQLARETPEMKILFALIMGFKISVNLAMIEALLYERSMGVGIKFDNFTGSQLDILANKLGVSSEVLSVILNPIPEGVAVVIMSMLKEE